MSKIDIFKSIKNLTIVGIILVLIVGLLSSMTTASTVNEAGTVGDLINCTYDDSWYEFDPSSEVGRGVTAGTNIPTDKPGGYCVDPHTYYAGTYKVVNIIDINNNTTANTVKVYGEGGFEKEYSFSNPNVRPYLMLAYLADKGRNEAGVYGNYMANSYKVAMSAIFLNTTYNNQMRNAGLSSYLVPVSYGYGSSSAKLQEAIVEAEKMSKQGSMTAGNITYNPTQEEKDNVSVIPSGDGKYFVGPYRLGITGDCTIEDITINGSIHATGMTTDLENVKTLDNIADNQEFYIVINEEVEEFSKIKVKGSETVSQLRSRFLIVSGGASQNFFIYKADSTPAKPEVELEVPKYGTIQILKKDSIKDSNLKLENIGFMVWSVNKQAYIIENKEGKIEYVDFKTAKANEFKTDAEGKTKVIKNLPVGRYKIYETSIPDELKIYYELPEIEMPEKGNKEKVKTNGKLVSNEEDKKDYFDITSGAVVPVIATNIRDFTTLVLEKIDKDTSLPVPGIGFKLFSTIKDKEGWVVVNDKNEVTGTTTVFDEATEFVTGETGLTAKINRVPVGDYLVYETNLGSYEDVYEELKPIRIAGGNTGGLGLYKGTAQVVANENNEFKFTAKNKQVNINISGKVWEDVPEQRKNDNVLNNLYDQDRDRLINGITVKLIDRTTGEVIKETVTKDGGKYRFEKVKYIEEQEDGTDKNLLENYYVEFTYDGVTYQNVVTPENEKDLTRTSKASEKARQAFNDIFTELTGEGQILNGVKLTYTKEGNNVYSNNICDRRTKIDDENRLVNLSTLGDFTITAVTDENYLNKAYAKLAASTTTGTEPVKEITDVDLGLYPRSQSAVMVVKDVHSAKLSINGFNHIYTYGKKSQEFYEKSAEDFNVGVSFKRNMLLNGMNPYLTPVYRSDYRYESDDKSKELKVSVVYKITLINNSANRSLVTKINKIVDSHDIRFTNMEVGTKYDEATGTISDNLEVKILPALQRIGSPTTKYAKAEIKTDMEIPRTAEGNSKEIYVKFDLSKEQIGSILENGEILDNVVEVSSYTVKQDGKLYASFDEHSIPNNANPELPAEFEDDTDNAPGLKLDPKDDRTMSGVVFEDNAISEGAGSVRKGNGAYDEGETTVSDVAVKLIETDKEGNVKEDGKTYDATGKTTADGKFTVSGYVPGYYKLMYVWGKNSEGKYDVNDYKGTIYIPRDTSKMDWYKNDNRYSDAMDNYDLRLAIDSGDTSVYSDLTKMESSTETFGIGIEYGAGTPGDNIITISEGDKFVRCDVSTMDFGIIERARQALRIDKKVNSVKVTTPDGSTLVDAIVNDEGKLEGAAGQELKYITGGRDLGFYKVEMDDDLIQDSKANVGYNIIITNISEIDYDSKEYYLYGEEKGNIITLQATKIFDYLKGAELDPNKEDDKWKIVDLDRVREMNSAVVKDRTVMEYLKDNLTREISPLDATTSETIYVLKPLTLSGEIAIDNNAEITNIVIGGTPVDDEGNATGPSTKFKTARKPDLANSTLFAVAETVTVTKPTGENRDYTVIIISSIAAIAVLGAGVIVIKKKVLNNK